jgi:hypothetical protein
VAAFSSPCILPRVIWGSGMERAPYLRSSFGHTLPNTMRPSFLNDGSVGAKGDIMIERAEEARPRGLSNIDAEFE